MNSPLREAILHSIAIDCLTWSSMTGAVGLSGNAVGCATSQALDSSHPATAEQEAGLLTLVFVRLLFDKKIFT